MKENLERNSNSFYGSSFDMNEVTLTDGIFKKSQETGLAFVKSLDVDRLLAPVAYSTGAIDDKSNYYGGWEAYSYRAYKNGNGISGHSLGHWLSAMSSMYAAVGDNEVKEKLDYAVDKLSEYQKKDGTGYIGGVKKDNLVSALKAGIVNASAFELNGYWVPWYSFHKIYQGLVNAYKLTGNRQALDVVKGFADWAVDVTSNLTDEQFAKMLECEYGGMNEVMAELYDITGDSEYYDLAIRFSQQSILNPLSRGIDELSGKHANTQIPKVIGAAALYDVNEDLLSYKNAALFFYDTVVNHRSYVIGGNSNREHFGTMTEEELGTQTCETCNTYNMMKLTEHLYAWEHRAEYMDYYEKALFNHILASQDPDTGEKTYFMATKPGHFKVYSDALRGNSFWCCVGSGMENPGRYTRNIYYKDKNEFYVNQFISSTVDWKEKGLKILQTTNYPYSDTTVIKIDEGNAHAVIKIRIPSWIASAAEVTVNGGDSVSVLESGYYEIERNWTAGDIITLKIPMALHTYTACDDIHKVSFIYGPIVLAGEFGADKFPDDTVDDHTSLDGYTSIDVPDLVVEDKTPDTFITARDLTKLKFTLKTDNTEISLIPYFDLHHERYTLYWNLYGKKEAIEKDEFTKALDAVTIDTVYAGEQQPEIDHAYKVKNSDAGYFDGAGRSRRNAWGEGGFFSYEMKVDAYKEQNYIMALYWGGVTLMENGISHTRDFKILVDDIKIGMQTLNDNLSEKFIYVYYKIPFELINGKEKITVKFMTNGVNTAVGDVFEVRTTIGEVQPK